MGKTSWVGMTGDEILELLASDIIGRRCVTFWELWLEIILGQFTVAIPMIIQARTFDQDILDIEKARTTG